MLPLLGVSRGLTAALPCASPQTCPGAWPRGSTPRSRPAGSCSRCSSPSATMTAPTARWGLPGVGSSPPPQGGGSLLGAGTPVLGSGWGLTGQLMAEIPAPVRCRFWRGTCQITGQGHMYCLPFLGSPGTGHIIIVILY